MITQSELAEWEKREETRLAQYAKKKWLQKRDQNSKIFRAIINQRLQFFYINKMEVVARTILNSPEDIHKGALKYFQDLLFSRCNFQILLTC